VRKRGHGHGEGLLEKPYHFIVKKHVVSGTMPGEIKRMDCSPCSK